jgi:hypothetical protein
MFMIYGSGLSGYVYDMCSGQSGYVYDMWQWSVWIRLWYVAVVCLDMSVWLITDIPYITSINRGTVTRFGPAIQGVCLWPLDCWDRGFESRWKHGRSSVVCSVGSGLCDGLIARSEESYVCLIVCDVEPRKWGSLGWIWAVAPQGTKIDVLSLLIFFIVSIITF